MRLLLQIIVLSVVASLLWWMADEFMGVRGYSDGEFNLDAMTGMFIGCAVSTLASLMVCLQWEGD